MKFSGWQAREENGGAAVGLLSRPRRHAALPAAVIPVPRTLGAPPLPRHCPERAEPQSREDSAARFASSVPWTDALCGDELVCEQRILALL